MSLLSRKAEEVGGTNRDMSEWLHGSRGSTTTAVLYVVCAVLFRHDASKQ